MLPTALTRLLLDEEGLTTVEYAVAGALVATTLVGVFFALGNNIGESISILCQIVKNDGTPCS